MVSANPDTFSTVENKDLVSMFDGGHALSDDNERGV